MRKITLAAAVFAVSLATSRSSRADEPPPPLPPPLPPTATPSTTPKPPARDAADNTDGAHQNGGWHPHSTLLAAGGVLFLGGYAPAAGAAVPSIAGLAARIVWSVGTLFIAPIVVCALHESRTYWCKGEHGSISLALPVAGPFLYAANHSRDTVLNPSGRELSGATRGLLYASGAAQAAGLSLVVASFAFGHDDTPDASGALAKREPGPDRSLVRAGVLLFGLAYAESLLISFPSLLVGIVQGLNALDSKKGNDQTIPWAGAELAIPVVGPVIFAAAHPRDGALNEHGTAMTPEARAFLYASGAAQTLGIALVIAGYAKGNESASSTSSSSSSFNTTTRPFRFGLGTSLTPSSKVHAPSIHFAPLSVPNGVGLTASITSW